tara:strand:+ start:754 stop:1005 length:252 start_codon:yes stop_codon:yes gene_type:complete
MSKWKTVTQEPVRRQPAKAVLDIGPLALTVDEAEKRGESRWQYVSLCFGEFSTSSFDECKETWPATVIAKLREAIDEWEAEQK